MRTTIINLGSKNAPLNINLSKHLIRVIEKYPFFYCAIKESLECAEIGYYSAGILTFTQILNVFNYKSPKERHLIAHEILSHKPTKNEYNNIIKIFKNATCNKYLTEYDKAVDHSKYFSELFNSWEKLMQKRFPNIV